MRLYPLKLIFSYLSWLILTLIISFPVFSFTFTVENTVDQTDLNPGDGECKASAGCTLRAAVQESNAWPGLDTIIVPAGTYLLNLVNQGNVIENNAVTGDLDISDSVIIQGAGAATTIISMDPGLQDRVFHILPTTTSADPVVVIEGLTISDGVVGAQFGAGVFNESTLSLIDTTISNNTNKSQALLGGGGIFNQGQLTLDHSVVENNTSKDGNGGGTGGGGIGNNSTNRKLIINNSIIRNNTANNSGAGINITGGKVSINNSTIDNNVSDNQLGGGISGFGNLEIFNSTISNNQAQRGGGIFLGGQPDETIIIGNTTISGNTATGLAQVGNNNGGGGINIGKPTTLTNVTISNNNSASGLGSGMFLKNTGSVTIKHSLLADQNTGNNCDFESAALLNNITSLGGNLSNDNSCSFQQNTDKNGLPVNLDTLKPGQGGATAVHTLLPGSINAIDTIINTNSCDPLDQRGFTRPSGAACDSGAYEATDPALIDLDLHIFDFADPVQTGETLTYQITLRNNGPSAASNVALQINLDRETISSAVIAGGSCSGVGSNNISCNLSSLLANGTSIATLTILPSGVGLIKLTASATANEVDGNTKNNINMTEFSDVDTASDLKITGISSAASVIAGTQLTLRAFVSNSNTGALARDVVAIIRLPSDVEFNPLGSDTRCVKIGIDLFCDVGNLNAGAESQIDINVIPENKGNKISATFFANFAGIELTPVDNQTIVEFDVTALADLSFSIDDSEGDNAILVGADFTYNMTIRNDGPSKAQNLVMIFTLPPNSQQSGFLFTLRNAIGFPNESWGCVDTTSGTIKCNKDLLLKGDNTSIILTFSANSAPESNPVTVPAGVRSEDPDPDLSNNDDTETTNIIPNPENRIREADLSVTVTDLPDPVAPGENLKYTITASNSSTSVDDAPDVIVTYTLNPAVILVQADPECVLNERKLTCSLNQLDIGTSASVNIIVKPTRAGAIQNTATVSSPKIRDTDLSNNSSNIETIVIGKDVTVETKKDGRKSGCFIATAAYGSYMDPQVKVLRMFRDQYLETNTIGNHLIELYYEYSPPLADYISQNESLRTLTRYALTPLVYTVAYPVPAFSGLFLVSLILLNRQLRRKKKILST